MKKNKIFLFFTFNTSLSDWSNLGLINREIEIYKKLTEKNYEVTSCTNGTDAIELIDTAPFDIIFLEPINFSAVPWLGDTLMMFKLDVKFTPS